MFHLHCQASRASGKVSRNCTRRQSANRALLCREANNRFVTIAQNIAHSMISFHSSAMEITIWIECGHKKGTVTVTCNEAAEWQQKLLYVAFWIGLVVKVELIIQWTSLKAVILSPKDFYNHWLTDEDDDSSSNDDDDYVQRRAKNNDELVSKKGFVHWKKTPFSQTGRFRASSIFRLH